MALIVTLAAHGSHAAVRVAGIVSGRSAAEHSVVDAPLVFAPVAAPCLPPWLWWSLRAERHGPAAGHPGPPPEAGDALSRT